MQNRCHSASSGCIHRVKKHTHTVTQVVSQVEVSLFYPNSWLKEDNLLILVEELQVPLASSEAVKHRFFLE